MKKVPIPTLVTAAALVAVLLLKAFTFQVRFSDVAVKVRLGKADDQSVIREPGLNFRWPWPIENVQRYDKRWQVLDTPETEVGTGDGNNLIVGAFGLWRIADPLEFYVSVTTMRRAEDFLRKRLRDARDKVIGQHQMAEFRGLDRKLVDANYSAIEQQMLDEIRAGVAKDYGIELTRVGIRRVSLPAETTQKVFESMIDNIKQQATNLRAEGDGAKAAIEGQAESFQKQILAFANRKAQDIVGGGMQASTRLLAQIEQEDKEFFIFLRNMEALENSFQSGGATFFLDSSFDLWKDFIKTPQAGAEGTN